MYVKWNTTQLQQMDLDCVILNEIIQWQEEKSHGFIFIYGMRTIIYLHM